MTLDFLVEEGLTDFQKILQQALSDLPHGPSDAADVGRLRGGLLEVLAWLNYERRDAPVLGLDGALAREIDGRVVAGRNGFDIIHLHLPRFRASIERPAVERVTRRHPHSIIVTTSFDPSDEGAWHFINVKEVGQGRRVFRRAIVEPPFVGRTVLETLSNCRVEGYETALDIQIAHEQAFDIEAVSKRFYVEYAREFEKLRDEVVAIYSVSREEADVAVQELLNRLIFLMFIQRKSWLPTPENPDRNFLWTEFAQSHRADPSDDSYHADFLHPLFVALSRRKEPHARRGLPAQVRQAPFLNGGLFDIDDEQNMLALPNSAFERLFRNLLLRYNFTVREDTPLEVEVAIDPEMLGQVFERLVLQVEKTGELDPRKATGSYYTPRPIVHFMCQQALREWLAGLEIVSKQALDTLFDLLPAERAGPEERDRLRAVISDGDAERLRERLLDVAVVDPAVGSGAFLVGMLHGMLGLLRLIDVVLAGPDAIDQRNYSYEIKHRIIERCLYGVDIQRRAVRICELRLWLSLVVDYELAAGEAPPALPNLTYRVVAGDSLIEHLLGHEVRWVGEPSNDRERQLVDAIQAEKQAHYYQDEPGEKRALEVSVLRHTVELAREILSHRDRETQAQLGTASVPQGRDPVEREIEECVRTLDQLSRKSPIMADDTAKLRRELRETFVWRLDFAEIFRRRAGFDMVIGNPPYSARFAPEVRYELTRRFNAYDLTKNSASFFIELALRLLRPSGVACLIVPKSLTFSEGWRPTRAALTANDLVALADVSEAFEDVLLEQVIFVAAKRPNADRPYRGYALDDHGLLRPVATISRTTVQELDMLPIHVDENMFGIYRRLASLGTPLSQLADIFRGLPWQSRATSGAEGVPIVRGREVQLYAVLPPTDSVPLTAEERCSSKVRRVLRPKVIAQQIVAHVRKPVDHVVIMAVCDHQGILTMDTVENVVPLDARYPLEYYAALLNSALARWFYYWLVYNRAVRTMHFDDYYVGKLPIPHPEAHILDKIVDRVSRISEQAKLNPGTSLGGDLASIQREIDMQVFHMFHLTPSEAKLILLAVGEDADRPANIAI